MRVELRLAPGEQAFVPLVAPDTRLARQSLNYIRGAIRAAEWPTVSQSTDAITMRRADGVEVVFIVLPAARAGTATRGRTFASAHLQEACFFRDADTGIVNDSEVYRSISARVVRGGSIFVESTPWMESGLLWDITKNNWGYPTTALSAKAPTLLFRFGDDKIARQVEAERARDPENAAREFDCQALSGIGTQYLDPRIIEASTTDRPPILDPREGCLVAAACDLAFVRDASAIVVVRVEDGVYRVAEVDEVRPRKGIALRPSEVMARFADVCRRHGARYLVADQHHFHSVAEFLPEGMTLWPAPKGNTAKTEMWQSARAALHEGRAELATSHDRLARQLREVTSKPLPGGGFKIDHPRRKGSHGDLAEAWAVAMYTATSTSQVQTARQRWRHDRERTMLQLIATEGYEDVGHMLAVQHVRRTVEAVDCDSRALERARRALETRLRAERRGD